ncbi:MAG: alpha/beta hydrolase [Candidatus Cloacimonetes bacterium]|nr:alpha/beta hydrolase [Candidatus Cloacimonadota bacterium]
METDRSAKDNQQIEAGGSYRHQADPGPGARCIQLFLGLTGMKRVILKTLINRKSGMKAAGIPGSLAQTCEVKVSICRQRRVWTLSPKNGRSGTLVLFLHGGAYFANLTRLHWRLVEKLLQSTGATFIVPDYPLAPAACCEDAYQFLEAAFARLIAENPSKSLVFMGDSAGGGLALGFAQKLRNEGGRQPEEIILFSPWLDVTMDNPDLARYDRKDKILSIRDLKTAGKAFAGDLEATDFRLSPIYGDLNGLGRIAIFTGTHDFLHPDALKFRRMADEQGIGIRFYEYPGMFHDWVLISGLKESRDVIGKVLAYPVFGPADRADEEIE